MVKSSTPRAVRSMLKDSLNIVLKGTEESLRDYVAKCKTDFINLNVEQIAFPAVNCNDVLVPGSSSTNLPLEEVDSYIDVCKRYSDYHPEHIWCIAKNSKKLWRNPDDLSEKEREGVAYACKLLGTKNPYEIAG